MRPSNEKELWEFVGEVRTDIKVIKATLVSLPCSSQEKEIVRLDERISKIEGKATIVSAIAGFISGLIFTIAGWILTKVKF
jgi:hypothetical protein